jgi:hypothetical protein
VAGAPATLRPRRRRVAPSLRRRAEKRPVYALVRLRESPLLRACAALAFVQYGALIAVLVSGGLGFWAVGTLAFFSLASWFFLFQWYPFLESLMGPEAEEGHGKAIGQVLETTAVLCVAAVHVMLLLTLARMT